jgi:integrase
LEQYRSEAAAVKIDTAKAALKDLRIHDLRRTLGSWQAAMGASLSVIGKSLGHTDMATTMVYARLDLDPVRQSMQKATRPCLALLVCEPRPP